MSVILLEACENLRDYICFMFNRMYSGKQIRKALWISFLSRIQKELYDILRVGNNLHPCLVAKGKDYFMFTLEHFKLYNTYNIRHKRFIMPILTLENIGVYWRNGNQFHSQCGSFCEAVEYSSCEYSDYISNCGPYLLVAWHSGLARLYNHVFRLLEVLDICMSLFV
jgi:hypothetical protein